MLIRLLTIIVILPACLKSAENERKKKHLEPCLEQRRHFTVSVLFRKKLIRKGSCFFFLKRLSMKLADKWYASFDQNSCCNFSGACEEQKWIRGSRILTGNIPHCVYWEYDAILGFYYPPWYGKWKKVDCQISLR